MATAGLCWLPTFDALGRFRVLAPDLRGHGRGIRSNDRFRFADCADDIAALAAELGVRSAIVAGYSMGGPVAQQLWKRHRPFVEGLVFAATSYSFLHGAQAVRMVVTSAVGALAQATRIAELAARLPLAGLQLLIPSPLVPATGSLAQWGAAEIRRHSLRGVIEAGIELMSYNAEPWIGTIDVPTAVVLTTHDRTVDPIWQLRLARAIPGATMHPVADGHVACGHSLFGEVFAEACGEVADRIASATASRPPAA